MLRRFITPALERHMAAARRAHHCGGGAALSSSSCHHHSHHHQYPTTAISDFSALKVGASPICAFTQEGSSTYLPAPQPSRYQQAQALLAQRRAAASVPLKQRIAVFGTAGIVLYLMIHFSVMMCLFVLLYVFEYDVVSVARRFGIMGSKKVGGDSEGSNKGSPSMASAFITAFALCKFIVPFKVALTVATAPVLAPKLNVLIKKFQRSRAIKGGSTTAKPSYPLRSVAVEKKGTAPVAVSSPPYI